MNDKPNCKLNGHGYNSDGVCIYCHQDDGTIKNATDEPKGQPMKTDLDSRLREMLETTLDITEPKLLALIDEAKQRTELEKDIKYHTLKAKYQRVFLGGEEDAKQTKRYVKTLKARLATFRKDTQDAR
jgi:hypothetical protein